MRVVFDGAPLGEGPITGVAAAFLNTLARYAQDAPGAMLLLPDGAPDPRVEGVDVIAAPRGRLRRQHALPRLLRRLHADLLHSPVAAVPLRAHCPMVATVHDLPWLHPEAPETTGPWQRLATRLSLRAASAVLAPSKFTFAAAARVMGRRRSRLHLVPHGLAGPSGLLPAANDRKGAFLTLGDDRPRKNRVTVARAAELARRQRTDLPQLRFAGPPEDYVTEITKLELLRSCRALVQCSRFEGFGMPVLEGLAHGTPVLCSDLPPHREIAGFAALFVDPNDPAAIADGIIRIHSDDALRDRLARDGPARAAGFSVETSAATWRRLHQELVH